MTVLTLFLVSGLVITEPISHDDCRDLIGIARFVDATGNQLSRDEGTIAALKCDGEAVVMMLPASDGPCDLEPSA
jgi:hypothetical protein